MNWGYAKRESDDRNVMMKGTRERRKMLPKNDDTCVKKIKWKDIRRREWILFGKKTLNRLSGDAFWCWRRLLFSGESSDYPPRSRLNALFFDTFCWTVWKRKDSRQVICSAFHGFKKVKGWNGCVKVSSHGGWQD